MAHTDDVRRARHDSHMPPNHDRIMWPTSAEPLETGAFALVKSPEAATTTDGPEASRTILDDDARNQRNQPPKQRRQPEDSQHPPRPSHTQTHTETLTLAPTQTPTHIYAHYDSRHNDSPPRTNENKRSLHEPCPLPAHERLWAATTLIQRQTQRYTSTGQQAAPILSD